jgi:hypothetical protein
MTTNTNGKHIMLSIDEDYAKYDLDGDFQWTCPCCSEVVAEHYECDKEDCEKCDNPSEDHAEFGSCRCASCSVEQKCKDLEYEEGEGYICRECKADADE